MRKVFKYILLAVIAVNLAVLVWVLLVPASPPRVVLPNPNGYDDFVKAGGFIKMNLIGDIATNYEEFMGGMTVGVGLALTLPNDKETYRGYAISNALRLLRTGLTKDCRAPIEYTTNFFTTWPLQSLRLERLELLLIGEGKLAEIEGRTNDAARIYLEGARFGVEQCRGGFLANVAEGRACEAEALETLGQVLGSLNAASCRTAAQELEEEQQQREPIVAVIARDKILSRRTTSLRNRFEALVEEHTTDPTASIRIDLVNRANQIEKEAGKLILDLAARAYELEKGKQPQSVAELVPEYLKAVPKDPATGKDLSLLGR